MEIRSRFSHLAQQRLLIVSIFTATIVVHTPPQHLEFWKIGFPAAHAVRSLLFFLSIGFLAYLIIKPVVHFFQVSASDQSYFGIVFDTIKIFAIVSLLVLPVKLGIMGIGYAQMSYSPFVFVDASGQLYQRLLMPSFAYIFRLRGVAFYHVFSLLISFSCLFLMHVFFRQKKIFLTTMEYVSIATSSFIITQFQSPGYTEPFAYVLILILLIVEMNDLQRAALFALCIFSHEASLLVLLCISAVFFSKKEAGLLIVIGLFYGFVWLASYGFQIERIISARMVGGENTVEWIMQHPFREVMGIIVSLKVLWLFVLVVFYKIDLQRRTVLLLLMPGILLTFIAVDTSRMAGFGFAALLYSILVIKQNNVLTEKQFKFVCAFNLCVPAVYVAVNSGIVFFDGAYQLLQYGIFIK